MCLPGRWHRFMRYSLHRKQNKGEREEEVNKGGEIKNRQIFFLQFEQQPPGVAMVTSLPSFH